PDDVPRQATRTRQARPAMTRERDLFSDPFTRHRLDDMETSVEAAHAIVPHLRRIRRQVYEWAKTQPNGFTDKKLTRAMVARYGGDESSTWRTRRQELTTLGFIHFTGEKRQHPPSKRWHAVWIVTSLAQK